MKNLFSTPIQQQKQYSSRWLKHHPKNIHSEKKNKHPSMYSSVLCQTKLYSDASEHRCTKTVVHPTPISRLRLFRRSANEKGSFNKGYSCQMPLFTHLELEEQLIKSVSELRQLKVQCTCTLKKEQIFSPR